MSKITKTTGVCGGRAMIGHTRFTVWGLVHWKQLGLSDEEILRRHQGLTPERLGDAWDYYRNNKNEIDRDIAENA